MAASSRKQRFQVRLTRKSLDEAWGLGIQGQCVAVAAVSEEAHTPVGLWNQTCRGQEDLRVGDRLLRINSRDVSVGSGSGQSLLSEPTLTLELLAERWPGASRGHGRHAETQTNLPLRDASVQAAGDLLEACRTFYIARHPNIDLEDYNRDREEPSFLSLTRASAEASEQRAQEMVELARQAIKSAELSEEHCKRELAEVRQEAQMEHCIAQDVRRFREEAKTEAALASACRGKLLFSEAAGEVGKNEMAALVAAHQRSELQVASSQDGRAQNLARAILSDASSTRQSPQAASGSKPTSKMGRSEALAAELLSAAGLEAPGAGAGGGGGGGGGGGDSSSPPWASPSPSPALGMGALAACEAPGDFRVAGARKAGSPLAEDLAFHGRLQPEDASREQLVFELRRLEGRLAAAQLESELDRQRRHHYDDFPRRNQDPTELASLWSAHPVSVSRSSTAVFKASLRQLHQNT